MSKKEYVSYDNLKLYDEQLKKYIDANLATKLGNLDFSEIESKLETLKSSLSINPEEESLLDFKFGTEEDISTLPYKEGQFFVVVDEDEVNGVAFLDIGGKRTVLSGYSPSMKCTDLQIEGEPTVGLGLTTVLNGFPNPSYTLDAVIWESSDPSICEIESAVEIMGLHQVVLRGKAPGTATITATCGKCIATYDLTVLNGYWVETILAEDFSPQGEPFSFEAPISLSEGAYIEVCINKSSVVGNKENLISIGERIYNWNSGGIHMHTYLTASNKRLLSLDVITDSTVIRPYVTLDESDLLTIRLDIHGISINGEYFIPDASTQYRNTPTLDWTTGIRNLTSLDSYVIGSQEGANRSNATYEYIKYVSFVAI